MMARDPSEGPGSSALLARGSLVRLLPRLGLLAAVAAFGFLSGGYIFTLAAPVAFALGGLGLAWIWLTRRGARLPWPYLFGLVALAAFALWTGLSVLWSVGPDLSWVSFDFALLYLLVAWFSGAVPVDKRQLRVTAYGYACVVSTIAVYALLGKLIPDVVTHAHTFARLSSPIGYWNVLAVVIAMAFPIVLEAAARRGAPALVRACAGSGLVLLSFTLFFTFSRGGFLALAVALLVYFALSTSRLSSMVSLAIAALPPAAVLYHVRGLATLFDSTTNDALRTAQGHTLARWVVVALALAFVSQLAVALVHRRLRLPVRAVRAVGTAVLFVLVSSLLAFGMWYFPRHGGLGDWVKTRYDAVVHDSADQGNDASRLLVVSSNGRIGLYREGIESFRRHEVSGTGAGTFRFANYRYREQPWIVKHAHSQWINILDELGVVGLVLFVVAIGGLLVAAFRRLFRERKDPERALLAACQAAVVAFVLHMSVDWDWDMAAATVGFLLLVGTAAAYVAVRGTAAAAGVAAATPGDDPVDSEAPSQGGPTAPARRPPRPIAARLFITGIVALALVSWALPYLAERAASAAVDQAGRQQLGAAASSARRASSLDPLAVDPLITLALVQEQQGRGRDAQATLDKALALQPRNYQVYYQMGLLELNVFGRKRDAAQWFRRGLALNPLDTMTLYQLAIAEGG